MCSRWSLENCFSNSFIAARRTLHFLEMCHIKIWSTPSFYCHWITKFCWLRTNLGSEADGAVVSNSFLAARRELHFLEMCHIKMLSTHSFYFHWITNFCWPRPSLGSEADGAVFSNSFLAARRAPHFLEMWHIKIWSTLSSIFLELFTSVDSEPT